MQKARRHCQRQLRPLVGVRFQVLFHSPSRGAFHLSLTVLVRYRSTAVFSLVGWAPRIRTGFHVSRPTRDPARWPGAARTGLSPSAARLSRRSRPRLAIAHAVPLPRRARPPVWANPRSLAATCGITVVFSSCGYLDVSVPRVRPTYYGNASPTHWVPPFGNPRVNGH